MDTYAYRKNGTIALCAAAATLAAALAIPATAQAATVDLQAQTAQGTTQAASKAANSGITSLTSKNATVKTTADKAKRVTTVKVKLSGANAKKYNVWYRVNVKGYGWMGWAKNNANAGSLAKGAYVTQVQTALVKKSAKKQKSTDQAAYSAKNGFMTTITGDRKTDAKIKKIAKKNGMNLKKCYKWANKLPYANTENGAGVKISEHKTMTTAHQNKIAKYVFANNRGDCYGTNVAFAKLAKYLGYSSNVYLGASGPQGNGKYANPQYGWAVVKTAGAWNIYDAYSGKYYNVSKKSADYKKVVRK